MKYFVFFLVCLLSVSATAQQLAMQAQQRNYTNFSYKRSYITEESRRFNGVYQHHPDFGKVLQDSPPEDCFEDIASRTEFTRKYIKSGTDGKEIMLQSSTAPMHYRDEEGRWRAINSKLKPSDRGVYVATEQPEPVIIDAVKGYAKLVTGESALVFNSNLQLIHLLPDGSEQLLGNANWSKHTAGDDGVYVTDIWPGIDMEIYVWRGAVKTNFYLKYAMPSHASGKLILRDHWQQGAGLKCSINDTSGYKGNFEILDAQGATRYRVGAATVYQHDSVATTLQNIGYDISKGYLDIVLPTAYLNKPASAYPIVIDPLVSTATVSGVGGSSYSPAKTISCNYVNAANVPPNVTVTDVRWSFNYLASGGALLLHGAVDFMLGTCRSPGVGGFFWYCNLASPGTCTGTNVSIFSDIAGCIPPPQCAAYPLNLNMRFYQNYATTTPCATTYITAGSPLTVTVYGRTVETAPISSVGGWTSICLGQSVTLSTLPSFGVPPYSYSWSPSGATTSPVTLTPPATTPYTVTVTDACGQTATAAQTILVNPIAPITGSNIVCVGDGTALLNPTAGGTWSSTNTAVAVVGVTTGLVTGVSAGTTTISYITSAGCYATRIVTVTPMPSAIAGSAAVCVGTATTLSNATPGGTWTSGNVAVAIVGAGTGMVTGMAIGTAVITYTTSPGCVATVVVTVYPNPVITGVTGTNPTTCGGTNGTITITGLVAGTAYTINYTTGASLVSLSLTAGSGGVVVISGLMAGVYTGIGVVSPMGCVATYIGIITLTDDGTPPMPLAINNSPLCEGDIIKLSATSAPGVSYTWWGPGGFTSTLQHPEISPAAAANAGVYSVTATLLGCVTLPATTIVTVNPMPRIWGLAATNPVRCGGNEGTITLQGLLPGQVYNIGYMRDGMPLSLTATADAAGNVTIFGLFAGSYTDFYAEANACTSALAGPVTLADPNLPPPSVISSNAPVCVGATLLLYGTNDRPGGIYTWTGPDGYTTTQQNPVIHNVAIAAQGVYTLQYTLLNCTSVATADIKLQAPVELKDVTASRYLIPFGDSVQLNVSGASYYIWTPQNGTLSDHYIYNPVAKPRDSITTYKVYGMNEWACRDSATITIRVFFDEDEYIPNAFTPNGDGRNDIFRIGKMQYKKLIDFTIYNRWGQEVYHNPYDPNAGWDGTSWGIPQDMGVYYYSIMIETAGGIVKQYKGDVTLIR